MNDNNLDATNVFGVPKARSNSEELYHRELQRKSLDIIRIKNPDDTEFFAEWDKRFWRVPAHGTLDVPRYIAIKYCKDKAVDTLNKLGDKMHEKDIEEREKKGLPPFESKWHEQQATYSKSNYPKTGDRELLANLYNEYWVGLVYEYGKDNPQQVQVDGETNLDMTPIELKIIQKLENRRVDVVEQAPVIKETPQNPPTSAHPVFVPKEKMVEDVTVEEPKNEPNTTTENQ